MLLEKRDCVVAGATAEVADGFCKEGDTCKERGCSFAWDDTGQFIRNRVKWAFRDRKQDDGVRSTQACKFKDLTEKG